MSLAPDLWTEVDPTLCPVCGRETCENHIPDDGPARLFEVSAPARLKAVRALDLIMAPQPTEIVEGMAWAGCISSLISESGVGKTFVLLDMAVAVSAGVSWHGRDVTQGTVVYIGFEADHLGRRLRALYDAQGERLANVHVVRAHDTISSRVTAQGEQPSAGETELLAALRTLKQELTDTGCLPIVLVIIDTVRASLAGNEDSSDVVSGYLRAVTRIAAEVPTAAAFLSHHAGWQDGENRRKRERGSSAWRGSCDATFFLEGGEYDVERGEKPITLTTRKTRDAEPLPPLHLRLRKVELRGEVDKRGRPLTSCVIGPDPRPAAVREAATETARQAQDDRAANEADVRVLNFIDTEPSKCGSQETIRKALAIRNQDVSAAIGRLMAAGYVVRPRGRPYEATHEGRAWLARRT